MENSKFTDWVDHADIYYNSVGGYDELRIWGRKNTGLLSCIYIDRTYDAMRFINSHNMNLLYTVVASDGNEYNVYGDKYDHYRTAIPA